MIRFFLLITMIFVITRLAFSQRQCWRDARRILGRVVVSVAVAFAILTGLYLFTARVPMSTDSATVDIASERVRSDVGSMSLLGHAGADEPVAAIQPSVESDNQKASDNSELPAKDAEADPQPDAGPATATTENDEAMVLLVTGDDLKRLLGEDGVKTLAGLEELQRVYAMVPLSAKGPVTIPFVFREALSPAALRQVFSPSGIRIMTAALSQILATAETDAADAAPQALLAEDADEIPVAERIKVPPHVLASWVENPGIGQVVVKSDFLVASTSEADALRDGIVDALKDRVSRAAKAQFAADDNWQKLVDVTLTDEAILDCVVSTEVRTEVINTPEGSHPMQQTYALVEIPEEMEAKVLNDVKLALRRNRLGALCICVAFLSLSAILFSAACRASQSDSVLRKFATFPVMALLILPCMLIFAFLVGAMIKGATFEFESEDGRISCVVDRGSTSR